MRVTQPISSPIVEVCANSADNSASSAYLIPPAELIENGDITGTEARLVPELRIAAQSKDATTILVAAVRTLYLHNLGFTPPSETLAFALADLAVTGRGALKSYRANPAITQNLMQLAISDTSAPAGLPGPLPAPVKTDVLLQTIGDIIGRTASVRNALYGPAAKRAALRMPLGWIAVSGEDDPPQRPVNVPGAPFPQYDIDVPVSATQIVTARFMIATSGPLPTAFAVDPQFGFPVDMPPSLPANGPVFLYIHGHMARLEESLDLTHALHSLALAPGFGNDSRITVISMDLPGMGYSSMVDDTQVSTDPSSATYTPFLDFIENYILHFVEALNALIPFKSRLSAILGGSLGGHMGLRFSMKTTTIPWLAKMPIVAWSPASVWDSFQGTIDPTKTITLATLSSRIKEAEGASSRHTYFTTVFDKPTAEVGGIAFLPPQPEMWYRDDWEPCKTNLINASRLDRREIYNSFFREWHWRIALEQLLFSFRLSDGHQPWYLDMSAKMLLASGEKDNYRWSNIYDATRDIASKMSNTPGTTLFLLDTGHSIHNERPLELAEAIFDFLFGGQLWHTMRFSNQTWQKQFGLVEGQEQNNPGLFTAIACAGVGNDMQQVSITGGQLWHTMRFANQTWQNQFGLIEGQEQNNPGPFTTVSCAGVGNDLQLVGIAGGQLWHTMRFANQTWQNQFGLIEGQEQNNPGSFSAIGCAGVGNDLQLVGIADGQLWHTIRFANQTWQSQFGLIEGQEQNNPGPFTAVSCASVAGDLHVVGIAGGQLWHTIRFANQTWQKQFGLIESQEQNNPGLFTAVACTGVGNDLQLVGIAGGQLWHTMRFANQTWQSQFGWIEGQEQNNPGSFTAVSCAGVAGDLQVVGIS